MWRVMMVRLAVAAALLSPRPTGAAEVTLTLQGALDLARERGPSVLAARGRIEEARGRRAGAAILLRDNPEVDLLRRSCSATAPRRHGGRSLPAP